MSNPSLFRRNLLIIAGLHILLIGGLYFSGFFSKNPDVLWVDGGGSPGSQPPRQEDTVPENTPDESTPEPTPRKTPDKIHPAPESEIVLATPTPRQTATPTPRPSATPTPIPKPTPTPTPKPSVTPKPTPKATASPTPKKKPSPSPKPSPKKSPSPKPGAKPSASPDGSASPKPSKGDGEDTPQSDSGGAATSGTTGPRGKPGTHPGDGGGNRGGHGAAGGAEQANQINWYLTMIHDRLYSRWQRPTSIVNAGDKLTATVKIRIEKDGRISDVSLSKSSGNALMDESVIDAAKHVPQIDPLPSAIDDSFYIVPIEFELTPN